METNTFEAENNELLNEVTDDKNEEPRRNTKKNLIAKIKSLCHDHEVPLTESDTTLQRSSKVRLQKLLAAKTEEVITRKMKHSIRNKHIEDSECAREHMAVATLQYGLSVLNKMAPIRFYLGLDMNSRDSWKRLKTIGPVRRSKKYCCAFVARTRRLFHTFQTRTFDWALSTSGLCP